MFAQFFQLIKTDFIPACSAPCAALPRTEHGRYLRPGWISPEPDSPITRGLAGLKLTLGGTTAATALGMTCQVSTVGIGPAGDGLRFRSRKNKLTLEAPAFRHAVPSTSMLRLLARRISARRFHA